MFLRWHGLCGSAFATLRDACERAQGRRRVEHVKSCTMITSGERRGTRHGGPRGGP